MSLRKTTQYWGDVVMFLPNKTIKKKNLNIGKIKMSVKKQHNMGEML